jgi:hypothetical protein
MMIVPSFPAEVGMRVVIGVEIGVAPVYGPIIVVKWLPSLGGIVTALPGFWLAGT